MVHTFLLSFFFVFYPSFSLLNVSGWLFYLSSCCLLFNVWFCWVFFVLRYSIGTVKSLQQRKVSSAQQHEYDRSNSYFIFLQTLWVYFLCVHSPLLCMLALPPGLGLPLASSVQFPSSRGPSRFSTILPAVDIQYPAPLNPSWLCSSPTIPIASLGISPSFPYSFSLRRANPS